MLGKEQQPCSKQNLLPTQKTVKEDFYRSEKKTWLKLSLSLQAPKWNCETSKVSKIGHISSAHANSHLLGYNNNTIAVPCMGSRKKQNHILDGATNLHTALLWTVYLSLLMSKSNITFLEQSQHDCSNLILLSVTNPCYLSVIWIVG